jgi:murein DD-endopeptidase MepM/ murein hydrolase activator NlpD
MAKPKYVTIMLVPDGTEARSGWRVRRWVPKTLIILLGALVVGIVLFFSFYGTVVSRAATTEQVMKENADLKRYYYKVQLLEQNMYQAREVVTRMTKLAGIDFKFPELPDDSTLFAEMESPGGATVARPSTLDWSLPVGLPIQGFVTQRFEINDPDDYHPGVDIACAVGTPVLATGSGVVEQVSFDSTYGNMVILRHNDSVTTVYGHNSKILVEENQGVRVGSRIAESGNSGVSSAPHLHYEIRINGEPIDPLDNPYDEKI